SAGHGSRAQSGPMSYENHPALSSKGRGAVRPPRSLRALQIGTVYSDAQPCFGKNWGNMLHHGDGRKPSRPLGQEEAQRLHTASRSPDENDPPRGEFTEGQGFRNRWWGRDTRFRTKRAATCAGGRLDVIGELTGHFPQGLTAIRLGQNIHGPGGQCLHS